MKTHIFQVEMTCDGCARAITNVLNKHKEQGISGFKVDLKTTTVEIESSLSKDELAQILQKTGKKANFVEERN